MVDMLGRGRSRWALVALGLGLLLLVPNLTQVMGSERELRVVVNAPQKSPHMTVLVATDRGLTGCESGTAKVEVLLGERIVFPTIYGDVPMQDCRGTIEVPYARFADKNAQYTVRATYNGMEAEDRVFVEKVVNWVYVRSFNEPEHQRARIEVAFDRLKAEPLTSSIFAQGLLEIGIRWEECARDEIAGIEVPLEPQNCAAEGQSVFYAEMEVNRTASTIIFLPWSNLDPPQGADRPEDGWYNVTATFHNDDARSNYNVPQDPSPYQESPPGNWFEVDYQ